MLLIKKSLEFFQKTHLKNKNWLYLLPLLFLVFLPAHGNSKDDWRLIKRTNSLKVYTGWNPKTGIKSVKISGTIAADLKSVQKALNETHMYSKWVYKCIESRKIKSISSSNYYYYVRTDMPFPLSDRDMVVLTNQWMDEQDVYHSESIGTPQVLPTNENIVRIASFHSHWKIHENGPDSVRFEYEVFLDPGGYIPNWLVNQAITMGPERTITDLEARSKFLMQH